MKLFFSPLGVNLLNLEKYLKGLSFDGIHFDIMDGHAVPNLGLPPWMIPAIKEAIDDKKVQVHLMANPVEKFIDLIAPFTPDIVFFHPKWCFSVEECSNCLREYGIKVGIVWNDDGSERYFDLADEILFMTVEPGRSGQELLERRIHRISQLMPISKPFWIDGGINIDNLNLVKPLNPSGVIAGKGIFQLQNQMLHIE